MFITVEACVSKMSYPEFRASNMLPTRSTLGGIGFGVFNIVISVRRRRRGSPQTMLCLYTLTVVSSAQSEMDLWLILP